MNKKYDVFICYRGVGQSGEFAYRLYNELSKLDFLSVFFAPRTVNHGKDFKKPIEVALKDVKIMILLLSKDFFLHCKDEDDIVFFEIKEACKNKDIVFLPITFPDFNYFHEDLSAFSEEEVNRFKHKSSIVYSGIYDSSLSNLIKDTILNLLEFDSQIESLKTRRKTRYYDANDQKEVVFLKLQENMLQEYDQPIYDNLLSNSKTQDVLDVGCNNGFSTLKRFSRDDCKIVVGIDRDVDCITYAQQHNVDSRFCFETIDVENEDFDESITNLLERLQITGFDLINISMVILHLENPFKFLKKIRKLLNPGGHLFIRDIDDDFNFCFPDTNGLFRRMTDICSFCDILGYRNSGKEIYTYLKRSGYKKVKIEKMGLNTTTMNYDEKDALFDIYFGYIPTALKKTISKYDNNRKLEFEYNWVLEHIDEANQLFHQDDFVFSLGYIIYTAEK